MKPNQRRLQGTSLAAFYGDIYWHPHDMTLDGDTSAIEYVAAY
jgi:hypothetical protein